MNYKIKEQSNFTFCLVNEANNATIADVGIINEDIILIKIVTA